MRDDAAQRRLFADHARRHAGSPPEFVLLNAGVIDRVALLDDAEARWQTTLDVDLRSVIVGVTVAANEARKRKQKERAAAADAGEGSSGGGDSTMSIVAVASAGGLYPMPSAPVYAAAKGGLVHFVRSAAPGILSETGARLTALCPEQVDTALVAGVAEAGLLPGVGRGQRLSRLLTPEAVADAAVALGEDREAAVGTALMVHVSGALLEAKAPRGFLVDAGSRFSLSPASPAAAAAAAPPPAPGSSSSSSPSSAAARAAWARAAAPASNRAVVVQRPGTDFRAATEIVARPIQPRLPPGFVLVRRTFAGVNASDVNFAAGRYAAAPGVAGGPSIPGSKGAQPPFPCGFEAVGVVAAAAADSGCKPGDAVAELCYDGFAELSLARASRCLKISQPDAAAVALLTSGLTASIGLEVALAGRPLRRGDAVVVTAAAGGTGQFVVQLAAAAGCRVVATCGGAAKAGMLRRLGAARVIDYKAEDVGAVLKREFPEVRDEEEEREKGGEERRGEGRGGEEKRGEKTRSRPPPPPHLEKISTFQKKKKTQGVDVVWESIGGAMFDACARSLKPVTGRLVIVGMMQEYRGEAWRDGRAGAAGAGLPELLLWRGATATGFFLLHHLSRAPRHLAALERGLGAGKLTVAVDDGRGRGVGRKFEGIESVAEAVEWLQSGRSSGKVVVRLPGGAQDGEGLFPGFSERGVLPGQGGGSRL